MTSIKPPSLPSPTATDLSQGPAGAGPASAQKAAEPSFSQALDQARTAGVGGETRVTGTGGDAVAELSRELAAGRLSADQALDRLVERAANGVARNLSASERAELLDVLRTALASDPTLAALRDSLR